MISRESEISLIPGYLKEHRQIGPLIYKAWKAWEETGEQFHSPKARQEMITQTFFPEDFFIKRQVIPADRKEAILATAEQITGSNHFLGVRTAYADPKLAEAPWLMQNSTETRVGVLSRFYQDYGKWMNGDGGRQLEAIVLMHNPLHLGEKSLRNHCFVLRFALTYKSTVSDGTHLLVEGRLHTDQTRDLEESYVKNGVRFRNENYDPSSLVRGRVPYAIGPYRVETDKLSWDQSSLKKASSSEKELLANVQTFFREKVHFSQLIARLIALQQITHHETIQFQGRQILTSPGKIDFLQGYNVRGHEEWLLVQEAASKPRKIR